ncbi:hypothetical protein Fot_03766 [Forsythia ovata]|uniref:Uncharacterized protein n=1 Tax=Forsythia ovata TaxID=205694 RepID=A0ABD1XAQ5_9LAMI
MNPTNYLSTQWVVGYYSVPRAVPDHQGHVEFHESPTRSFGWIEWVFPYPATRLGMEEFLLPGTTRLGKEGFLLPGHKAGYGGFLLPRHKVEQKGFSPTRPQDRVERVFSLSDQVWVGKVFPTRPQDRVVRVFLTPP